MKTCNQSSQASLLRLDSQLCFSLYAASRLMTRAYQPLLEPLGLTYPQYVVLLVLWEDAPCSVSQVGQRVMLNSNTLTPLLKRLEQLGYVTRARNADDERVVEVALTTAGRKLRGKCAGIPQKLMEGVPADSLDELLQLKGSLDRLIGLMVASEAEPV
ncbi:MarR family transcriptional regulator [Bremerella cremea]|uniref:MarR family winged helix-turn-helix transcriptional regulator n=1 Tax=Bremerella cremea TaxID=1031537 RepID=UPI0031ED3B18